VIVGALHDPLAVLFMRTLSSQNSNVPFIDYDGATYSGVSGVKNPSLHVLSSITTTGQGDSPGLARYRAVLSAAGLDPTTAFINVGYVEGLIIGEGLKACGFPCTGEKLQKALDSLQVETGGVTSGPIKFSPDNHEPLSAVTFYSWDTSANGIKIDKADVKGGSQ
jgi:ABC-type branched-subunit amino acid transport system substrate-binding protein